MADLNAYLEKRGITDEQMAEARAHTKATIDAYALREARKATSMTQVQLAQTMGVSQNRISRMENADMSAMSVDSVRRYIEALGGKLMLVADLPTGRMLL